MAMAGGVAITIRAVTLSFTPGKEKWSCVLISMAMAVYVSIIYGLMTYVYGQKQRDQLLKEVESLKVKNHDAGNGGVQR